MAKDFKPQVTTMNSFQETEQTLYSEFKSFGYSDKLSECIAHSFTRYMLGYWTEAGVAEALRDAGADEAAALTLVSSFRRAKRNAEGAAAGQTADRTH